MTTAQKPDKARIAGRLTIAFFLRVLQLNAKLLNSDLFDTVILEVIISGNVSYLFQQAGGQEVYTSVDAPVPDELRRPMSVLSIANSLGIPYETARRHVTKLEKSSRVVRVKGGVIVPSSLLSGPREDEIVMENLSNIRRLFFDLRRAGVDLES